MKQTSSAVELFSKEEDQPVFAYLQTLVNWIGRGNPAQAGQRFEALLKQLQEHPEHTAQLGEALYLWLLELDLYPALVSVGIFSRRGAIHEWLTRLSDRINPPPYSADSSRDLLSRLFGKRSTAKWLKFITARQWLRLFTILTRATSPDHVRKTALYIRTEVLYALEMLGIWVAAEELEPELVRMDQRLIDIDSPFIALQRELHQFVQHENSRTEELSLNGRTELPFYDPAHLWVMLDQCHQQVARLRRKGAGAAGSSVAVAHLLERLVQTLERIESLLLLTATTFLHLQFRTAVELWQSVILATTEKNSLSAVWRNSIGLLARSITQNKSDHGEHYIARDSSAYFFLIRSAAGAGVFIACMALIKIQIESWGPAPLSKAVLVSLNYGLGFMLVHLLHFTIATKQPAMTAASFAEEVERGEKSRTVQRQLAGLLIDVNRSQWAAVWGNVTTAIITAGLLSGIAIWWLSGPLLTPSAIDYQLQAINPLTGPALFYAAIAGVWLFCSGIIAGYFDNRADYLELRLRLRQHPCLQGLKSAWRDKFADYLHENYGALAGNFFFGVLLGMTGYLGYLLDLPLDIRHVAFSSANLGYASFSGTFDIVTFLLHLLFVFLIGFLNLWVSFSLALLVALRARGTRLHRVSGLLVSVWQQIKDQPLRFFFPLAPNASNSKKARPEKEESPSTQ